MFYVGLDVSVGRTSVCIMDAIGQVVREQSVASTPEAIATVSGRSEWRSSGWASRQASIQPGSRAGCWTPSCRHRHRRDARCGGAEDRVFATRPTRTMPVASPT